MKIICDTREQANNFILEAFKKNNIDYEIKKLNIGDYAIEDGDQVPNIVIERKGSLSELISNLTDNKTNIEGKNRFIRMLDKCYKANIRVYLLIECDEGDLYNSIMKKQYRNEIEPNKVRNWIYSLEYTYPNLIIRGCSRGLFASNISSILQYGLKRFNSTKTI